MTKQLVKVDVTTIGGFTKTADDAVLAGQGTAAYGAIENGRNVIVADATEKTIIPFRAIDHAVVTLTLTQEQDPVDPTCVTPTP